MESFGIELITNGGAVAVLFVIMLLGFAWCYFKIKSIEIRLQQGDVKMSASQNEISSMAKDISFIRGLLEGQKEDGKK